MSQLRAAVVPVTPFEQNCSVFWTDEEKKAVVIDPGGDLDRIEAVLKEHGLTIDYILLTHGHIDHAGGATELSETHKVKIIGPHKDDQIMLDNLEQQGANFGLNNVRPVSPDKYLEEGDSVDIAGHNFDVLHCPGHSPGSVVFINKALKFAIVGDVLFAGSVGRTDLPGGDFDTLMGSIKNKLFLLDDDVSFLCGHGPGSTIGQEKQTNPFVA